MATLPEDPVDTIPVFKLMEPESPTVAGLDCDPAVDKVISPLADVPLPPLAIRILPPAFVPLRPATILISPPTDVELPPACMVIDPPS